MRTVAELQDLSGRIVLITGGAGHLGRAFTGALLQLGATVILADRTPEVCAVAEALAGQHGGKACGLVVDLTDESAVRELPARVLAGWNHLDVLVNNAAFVGTSGLAAYAVPFAKQSVTAWRQALELNLTVPFLLTQLAAPALQARGFGSVINISSIYGVVGPDMGLYEGTQMGNPAAYGASKGGLVQLTRYLATVLAPNTRVNCISPGGILRGQNQVFVERYRRRTPMDRMASEEDLVGAMVFLASDLSAYVTGQNLMVDGGWTVW